MKTLILMLSLIVFCKESKSQSGWVLQNIDLINSLNDVFFINSQTGWAVADSTKVLKTTNGGVSWTNQTLPQYSPLLSVFFINENTGWVGGGYWYNFHFGVLYKTTNGGISWTLNAGILEFPESHCLKYSSDIDKFSNKVKYSTTGEVLDVFFIDENTGFKCWDNSDNYTSYGGISRTTNGGNSWEGTTNYSDQFVFTSIYFENSTGWACGYRWNDTTNDSLIIVKSTDSGNSWTMKFLENFYPVWSNYLNSIFALGNKIWASGVSNYILISTNSGDNWEKVFYDNPRSFKSIFFINLLTGWAGGFRYPDTTTIMKSTNGGLNWFNLRNPYQSIVNSLTFIDENTGWAVGAFGMILKTTTGGLTFISNTENEIINYFQLGQNFPNPFNPSTTIKFDINKSSFVKLNIYDIQGKLIETLFEGNINPGTYKADWNAEGNASGIYVYVLKADGFILTKRMTLVK